MQGGWQQRYGNFTPRDCIHSALRISPLSIIFTIEVGKIPRVLYDMVIALLASLSRSNVTMLHNIPPPHALSLHVPGIARWRSGNPQPDGHLVAASKLAGSSQLPLLPLQKKPSFPVLLQTMTRLIVKPLYWTKAPRFLCWSDHPCSWVETLIREFRKGPYKIFWVILFLSSVETVLSLVHYSPAAKCGN